MPLPVSLDDVAQELDCLLEDWTTFVNRKTGEIMSISDEETALAEDEEVDEDKLPEWQAEMLPQLHEIVNGEDWVVIATKFDVHEWEIMRKFAQSVDDDDLSNELNQAIHGRGAFRMFRATLEDAGLIEVWYKFKKLALRDLAREMLEGHGIPYCGR